MEVKIKPEEIESFLKELSDLTTKLYDTQDELEGHLEWIYDNVFRFRKKDLDLLFSQFRSEDKVLQMKRLIEEKKTNEINRWITKEEKCQD